MRGITIFGHKWPHFALLHWCVALVLLENIWSAVFTLDIKSHESELIN